MDVGLVDEIQQTGEYSIEWAASSAPSGVYFYVLTVGQFTAVKRIVLVR